MSFVRMKKQAVFILGLFFLGLAGCSMDLDSGEEERELSYTEYGATSRSNAQNLVEYRGSFRTRPISSSYEPDGAAPIPPGKLFKKVLYKSGANNLVAYLSNRPGDGKKHPAIIWAHGGFGGIGRSLWSTGGGTGEQLFHESVPGRRAGGHGAVLAGGE